jgi:hypothetical protein
MRDDLRFRTNLIKKNINKKKNKGFTVKSICNFVNIPLVTVYRILRKNKKEFFFVEIKNKKIAKNKPIKKYYVRNGNCKAVLN